MERYALKTLLTWKEKPGRKPLIIRGARQVGKTWLIREFGKKSYEKTAYVNFESSKFLKDLFLSDFSTGRILTAIQIETGVKIEPHNTLIILDEIQEAEGGLTALKYFYENDPEYHIIAAGSLLGVSLHTNTSFPVGKVDFMDLNPLSFKEFLMAMKEGSLVELLDSMDWKLMTTFKSKFIFQLKQYYFLGGMPEVVSHYIKSGSFTEAREIQRNILSAYERDFSKHAPPEIVPRIRMVWNSILSQLSRENRKFIYGMIKKGSRAKDFELALSWLEDCGLIYKVTRISKPGQPLKAYEDFTAFKLFIIDVGLLGAMGDLDEKKLIEGNALFEEFKGALTEQYVLQQLKTIPYLPVHYWSAERSEAELDFVIQLNSEIFPIEVKAEENLMAKSLKSFHQKYPKTIPIRTSMSNFRQEEWLTNLPLYAIMLIPEMKF